VTLSQAVAIASIFEFCGVLFLGASVTSTVRGKIFNTSDYEDQPEIVLLGMFTSLVSASFMMMIATYMGMPVSTTHTVIGCIIGFAVSASMLYLNIFSTYSYLPNTSLYLSFIFSRLPMVYNRSIGMKQRTFSSLG
jgi:phosphate/sulfate permease